MPKYYITGGNRLHGNVTVQGAKNSVLPLMAAALMASDGTTVLRDVPLLRDVETAGSLLRCLGCDVNLSDHTLTVTAVDAIRGKLDLARCKQMRSSILYLTPMLARFGEAELYLPGGCSLGERPIDLHIAALRQMGVEFVLTGEEVSAHCPDGLHGAEIHLIYPSVGATENIVMAAALAKGQTVLHGAALEPEIDQLILFLNQMGADIRRRERQIVINGVERLHGTEFRVMPDRIAAFTLFAAALATDGEITVLNCPIAAMRPSIGVLARLGGGISVRGSAVTVSRAGRFLLPAGEVTTGPFPEFSTDNGAATLVLMAQTRGRSLLRETVFSGRFAIAEQLRKFGADITVRGDTAYVEGVSHLTGGVADATDLRAGAALLIAALSATGHSIINGGEHIDRGYENITGIIRNLGGNIIERS